MTNNRQRLLTVREISDANCYLGCIEHVVLVHIVMRVVFSSCCFSHICFMSLTLSSSSLHD
mgnify:FL=1